MRTTVHCTRRLLILALSTTAILSSSVSIASADAPPATSTSPAAGTELLFSLRGGGHLSATSYAYDREELAPLVSEIDALPHGPEMTKLKLDVATPGEITRLCGEETMACYDPLEDRMVIDGQEEETDGVSRASLIAHEYGHHIANNREGGIWSAFEAGTPRWSTYEEVCERTRAGELFPGNEGAHYWENPGEAFAQTYATLVVPETPWPYTPLLKPDETSLRLLREDVLDPVEPQQLSWRIGSPPSRGPSIGNALPVEGSSFDRTVEIPFDGRIAVHLDADEGGRYRLTLLGEAGEVLSRASPGADGKTTLNYADCGHRAVELEAESLGSAGGFTAQISAP